MGKGLKGSNQFEQMYKTGEAALNKQTAGNKPASAYDDLTPMYFKIEADLKREFQLARIKAGYKTDSDVLRQFVQRFIEKGEKALS